MALLDQELLQIGSKNIAIPTMFVAVMAGGIWYAATQHAAVDALTTEVRSLKQQMEQRSAEDTSNDRRLTRMETLLEAIDRRLAPEQQQRAGGPR